MTIVEVMRALAAQLTSVLRADVDPLIPKLQVRPLLEWNPTPPCIDIYPADPFQEEIAMKTRATFLVVRARVNTPDNAAAQELLLAMMDDEDPRSVIQAVRSDATLGGAVESVTLDGPSEFGAFTDPGGNALLGCTWRAQVLR